MPSAITAAQLAAIEAHAIKDLWAVSRATCEGRWVAHYGFELPASKLTADGAVIAEFRAPGQDPDENPRHNADAGLASRAVTRLRGLAEKDLRLVSAIRDIERLRDRQPDGDPAVPVSEVLTILSRIWEAG